MNINNCITPKAGKQLLIQNIPTSSSESILVRIMGKMYHFELNTMELKTNKNIWCPIYYYYYIII